METFVPNMEVYASNPQTDLFVQDQKLFLSKSLSDDRLFATQTIFLDKNSSSESMDVSSNTGKPSRNESGSPNNMSIYPIPYYVPSVFDCSTPDISASLSVTLDSGFMCTIPCINDITTPDISTSSYISEEVESENVQGHTSRHTSRH